MVAHGTTYFSVIILLAAQAHSQPAVIKDDVNLNLPNDTSLQSSLNSARWVSLTSASALVLRAPEPIGIEDGVQLFLCRAQIGSLYKPGSTWINNGVIFCRITDAGLEHGKNSFQILEAPKGATSWVRVAGSLPPDAIVGGTIHTGKNNYVCRGWNGGSLIAGHYDADSRICFAARGGKEQLITGNLEILVLNGYGLAI